MLTKAIKSGSKPTKVSVILTKVCISRKTFKSSFIFARNDRTRPKGKSQQQNRVYLWAHPI